MKKYCNYQNENAKRYLNHVRTLKKIANEQELTLKEFMLNPQKLTAVISDMPKGGGQSDLSDVLVRYEELKETIIPELNETLKKYHAIVGQILHMENKSFSHILYAYYVNGKSWKAISDDVDYSWRHLMRIKELALEEFEREYKDEILLSIRTQ